MIPHYIISIENFPKPRTARTNLVEKRWTPKMLDLIPWGRTGTRTYPPQQIEAVVKTPKFRELLRDLVLARLGLTVPLLPLPPTTNLLKDACLVTEIINFRTPSATNQQKKKFYHLKASLLHYLWEKGYVTEYGYEFPIQNMDAGWLVSLTVHVDDLHFRFHQPARNCKYLPSVIPLVTPRPSKKIEDPQFEFDNAIQTLERCVLSLVYWEL